MAAPKGNKFWMVRSSHGRKPIFKTPEDLWSACCEYFEWVEKNPLMSAEVVKYQGGAKLVDVPKMRAMTLAGLCLFLDISDDCWDDYRKRQDFVAVTTRAEKVIYAQKFAGAAAELLNPNIIARDLGLRDKTDLELTGKDGGPVEYTNTERAARLAAILERGRQERDRQSDKG